MSGSRTVAWLGCAAAALTLVGCSQVAELQPVAGDGVTSVRIATTDVLTSQKVPIQQVPVCTYQDSTYSCQGTTASGEKITSTGKSVAASDAIKKYPDLQAVQQNTLIKEFVIIEVKVGSRVLYAGPSAFVLNKAGRVGS